MSKHEPFITVAHGISGYFTVCMSWNPDGFWEPWNTGFCRFATREEAVEEGRYWAAAEEIEFKS